MKNTLATLGSFVDEVSVRNRGAALSNVFSVTNSGGFVPSTDYFKKEVFSKDLSTYKVVRRGMLAYNPSRINVGSIAVQNRADTVVVSPLYVVLSVDESRLRPDYLDAFLHSPEALAQIRGLTSGSVRDTLSFRAFARLQLPVPSLAKQDEALDRLARVRRLQNRRQKQLSRLDELAKSLFVDMFGDPATNPSNWKTERLKSCSELLSDGPFGSNLKSSHYVDSGIRVIRLQNIGVGVFLDEDKAFISKSHYDSLKRFTCRPGEVVIGTLGDPNLRACLVPSHIGCAINKSDCVHFIPKHELLLEAFVVAYINSPGTLSLVSSDIHGQTRSRVSSGQLAKMPIFLPPLSLQRAFGERVEAIDKSKFAVRKSLDELNRLYRSLLQQYFG